jgi:hypothetical protein
MVRTDYLYVVLLIGALYFMIHYARLDGRPLPARLKSLPWEWAPLSKPLVAQMSRSDASFPQPPMMPSRMTNRVMPAGVLVSRYINK